MRTATEAKWAERVAAWRASGMDAATFTAGKGYEASTLRWWASRLGRDDVPPIVPVVTRSAPLVRRDDVAPGAHEMFVEVGAARVRVARGFDGELLVAVVRALAADAVP